MLYLYYITNSIGADFDYGILKLGFLEFIQNYNFGASWRQIQARLDNRRYGYFGARLLIQPNL